MNIHFDVLIFFLENLVSIQFTKCQNIKIRGINKFAIQYEHWYIFGNNTI